ncbi:hypothetical protein, partial [Rhizobium johnstonii]|uniref:hypothetical protein n=1 Tax=Rhizobium johnstonii TaxID=3019933 RepID=UPI003F9B4F68
PWHLQSVWPVVLANSAAEEQRFGMSDKNRFSNRGVVDGGLHGLYQRSVIGYGVSQFCVRPIAAPEQPFRVVGGKSAGGFG